MGDYNMSRLCLLGFLMICAAGARIVDQADPSNHVKLEKFVELAPFERVAKLEPFDDGNVAELEPYEEVFAKLIENDEEEEEESFAELLLDDVEDDTDLLLDEEEDEDEVEESTTVKVGKQKVVKRKLLNKYLRLQRMLNNVEKKLNRKERKFVQLKKNKTCTPLVRNKFRKLMKMTPGAKRTRLQKKRGKRCSKAEKICCDGSTPSFDIIPPLLPVKMVPGPSATRTSVNTLLSNTSLLKLLKSYCLFL